MGGMAVMTISSLLILVAIIVGVVPLVRYLNRSDNTARLHTDGAESVLAERYARREIDEQEYQQRLATPRGRS